MSIRLAKTSDLQAIAECEELAFELSARRGTTRDASQSELLAQQVREREIHVISDAARIVGYISFSPSSDHLYVDSIAVLPRHHRQGLGSRLLTYAEDAASRMGLGSVKLFTDGRIARNVRFYARRGYRETGRCDDDNFSRIFYSKPIAA